MNRRSVTVRGSGGPPHRPQLSAASPHYIPEPGAVNSRGEASESVLRSVRSCACLPSQCAVGCNQTGSATMVAHAPRSRSLASRHSRLNVLACEMEGKGGR